MIRVNLDYRANSTVKRGKASPTKPRINLDYRASAVVKRGKVSAHLTEEEFLAGERHSLEMLWRFRDNPEMVGAILLAGSLFERIGSSRSHYPLEVWPYVSGGKALYHLINERLDAEETFFPWHYSCTQVFPWESDDSPPRAKMSTYGRTALLSGRRSCGDFSALSTGHCALQEKGK